MRVYATDAQLNVANVSQDVSINLIAVGGAENFIPTMAAQRRHQASSWGRVSTSPYYTEQAEEVTLTATDASGGLSSNGWETDFTLHPQSLVWESTGGDPSSVGDIINGVCQKLTLLSVHHPDDMITVPIPDKNKNIPDEYVEIDLTGFEERDDQAALIDHASFYSDAGCAAEITKTRMYEKRFKTTIYFKVTLTAAGVSHLSGTNPGGLKYLLRATPLETASWSWEEKPDDVQLWDFTPFGHATTDANVHLPQ